METSSSRVALCSANLCCRLPRSNLLQPRRTDNLLREQRNRYWGYWGCGIDENTIGRGAVMELDPSCEEQQLKRAVLCATKEEGGRGKEA
jgi:hypothetical protein